MRARLRSKRRDRAGHVRGPQRITGRVRREHRDADRIRRLGSIPLPLGIEPRIADREDREAARGLGNERHLAAALAAKALAGAVEVRARARGVGAGRRRREDVRVARRADVPFPFDRREDGHRLAGPDVGAIHPHLHREGPDGALEARRRSGRERQHVEHDAIGFDDALFDLGLGKPEHAPRFLRGDAAHHADVRARGPDRETARARREVRHANLRRVVLDAVDRAALGGRGPQHLAPESRGGGRIPYRGAVQLDARVDREPHGDVLVPVGSIPVHGQPRQ